MKRRNAAHALSIGVLALLGAGIIAAAGDAAGAHDSRDGVVLVERTGMWHVPSEIDHTFFYGNPGDVPLLGDWDGDGIDTPGVFRPASGFAHLTNTMPGDGGVGVGDGDLTFFFGMAGDQVVVGDWDADGVDTLGIRRGSRMLLSNINATAVAETSFLFGIPGDVARGGDPLGTGRDGIFLYRRAVSTVFISHSTPATPDAVAPTDAEFVYGRAGDRFLVGDWDGDGVDTVGVYRPGEGAALLRNANSSGPADLVQTAGRADWVPVAGRLGDIPTTASSTTSTTSTTTVVPATVPPAGFTVAVIGDSGDGESFRRVLSLIRDQGADVVVHNGDFSYSDGPTAAWTSAVDDILARDFPYVGSDGNHDDWSLYVDFFRDRLDAMGVEVDTGSLASASYGFTYRNVRFAFSPEGGDASHVAAVFAAEPDVAWRIAGWHKNMTAMQVEEKGDEQGWGDYETAREAGAIITTGHAHSYARTKTLSDISDQVVALDESGAVEVRPGETFVVVSGLGGQPPRAQERCLPADPPYGCSEWAAIYTSSQQATHGALFLTLHVDGDPARGLGRFVNVDGEVIDEFTISLAD